MMGCFGVDKTVTGNVFIAQRRQTGNHVVMTHAKREFEFHQEILQFYIGLHADAIQTTNFLGRQGGYIFYTIQFCSLEAVDGSYGEGEIINGLVEQTLGAKAQVLLEFHQILVVMYNTICLYCFCYR